jgi:hypothetical protein
VGKLHQPQHAQIECAVGQRINLPARSDSGHLVSKFGKAASPEIKKERLVAEQGSECHGEVATILFPEAPFEVSQRLEAGGDLHSAAEV